MEFLVIMSAICGFFVVCLLLSPLGRKWDEKQKRLHTITSEEHPLTYEELEMSFYRRFIFPRIHSISKVIARIGSKNKAKNNKNEQLEQKLKMAGIRMSSGEYNTIRLMTMVGILIAAVVLGLLLSRNSLGSMLIILCGVITAVLVPRYFLSYRITSRRDKIRSQLPEVMDLLCVSMQAGLGFDAALLKIAEKMNGPLIDELKVLYREVQMGRPRREAYKNLGESSDINELKTFSSAMAQADQLGIPVNNVLKVQSTQLRIARKQRAQEKGMKAPVKMMLPMIAFIFPVIFIILLGPTLIKLLDQFGK